MARLWHVATFHLRDGFGFRVANLSAAAERLAALAQEPAQQVQALLVWTEPRAVVAEAIAAGGNPFDALSAWTDETRLHLALARQAGQGCLVVARHVLEGPPKAGLPPDLPRLPPSAAPAPLVALLADAILQRAADANDLLARLGAEGAEPVDADAALVALLALQARASTADTLSLAQLQLEQTAAHLDVFYIDAEARRSELNSIYASRSWRVTEPLRASRRLIDRRF